MHRKKFLKQTLWYTAGVIAGVPLLNSCKKENSANSIVIGSKFSGAPHIKLEKNKNSQIYLVIDKLNIEWSDKYKAKLGSGYVVKCNVLKAVKRTDKLSMARINNRFVNGYAQKNILEGSTMLSNKIILDEGNFNYEIKTYKTGAKSIILPSDKDGNTLRHSHIALLTIDQFNKLFSNKIQPLTT